jgi:hypothetical protein
MTKYIVDNVTDQTITGNLRIDGGLKITDGTYSVATYKALLTQTATASVQNFMNLNTFIIGETYTITDYVAGDDFSNIANVVSGVINETGCQFIATGEIPNVWTNSSTLENAGNFIVDVLENNLGFDINWFNDFIPGVYIGINATTGPIHNAFPRTQVSVMTGQTVLASGEPFPVQSTIFAFPGGFSNKDEVVVVVPYDFDALANLENSLYYTPVEISFKQSLDTTPILATGSVVSSYPFGYVSVDLKAGERFVQSFYADNQSAVNNIDELITLLNTDIITSYLGTFGYDGSGNILLTIATNLKNQFSPDNTLTFEVYAD